jgi:hypothetical protein
MIKLETYSLLRFYMIGKHIAAIDAAMSSIGYSESDKYANARIPNQIDNAYAAARELVTELDYLRRQFAPKRASK